MGKQTYLEFKTVVELKVINRVDTQQDPLEREKWMRFLTNLRLRFQRVDQEDVDYIRSRDFNSLSLQE